MQETIIDEATSAFSGSHLSKGRLGEFLKRVEAGEIAQPHTLLVESFDRLNRQVPLDALGPFIALMNAGITIVTLLDRQVFTRESLSADGGLRLLMSLLVMVRAHEESATKSRRVSAAWERKRQRAASEKLTRACPGWLALRSDRSGFTIIEERADVVRRIFRETAAGIGKAAVASRLNAAGIPAFRGANGWHPSAVQKVIASDAALGIYQPHRLEGGRRQPAGEPIPDYFPSVVEPQLVRAARAAVIARRSGAGGRKGRRFANLFAGRARCGECGATMVFVTKSEGEEYLTCSGARRRQGCVNRHLFNYQNVESWVFAGITEVRPARGGAREEPLLSQHRVVQERIRIITEQIVRLVDEFAADGGREIAAALGRLRTERDTLERQERAVREQVLVVEQAPDINTAKRKLAELSSRFAEHSGRDLYAVRAEVAETIRRIGLQLTFDAGQRIQLMLADAVLQTSAQSIRPRTVSLRDPATGRFSGRARVPADKP